MRRYDDILHLPRPVSTRHPSMSRGDRAAQFAPFAALTGHDALLRETGRLTEEETELTEDEKALLNRQLQSLAECLSQSPEITVTWFRPDDRKPGGACLTATGRLVRLDPYTQTLHLEDLPPIPMEQLRKIDAPGFA